MRIPIVENKYIGVLFKSLLLLIFLSSCEDVIDVKLEEGPPQLVVDGLITNLPGPHKIKLTETTPFFNNQLPPPANNVEWVILMDNEGYLDTLKEVVAGSAEYFTSDGFSGKTGNTYTISIKWGENIYSASSQLKRVATIDSLAYEFRQGSLFQEEGYYMFLFGRDLPGQGDFYRFTISRNGKLYNKPQNLIIFNDRSTDGLPFIPPIEFALNPEPYELGDTLEVNVYSIDEQFYDFWMQVQTQANNSGLFPDPIANVPSNLRLADEKGGSNALGWFGASGVSTAKIIVK